MIAEWIENLRFDLIEPIGMVLVGVIWFLTLLKIVRGGLRQHGQVAEGLGGGGGGGAARSSTRDLYLEVLKDHAVGMATATGLAVLFFAFAANLEELSAWGLDLFESARPG